MIQVQKKLKRRNYWIKDSWLNTLLRRRNYWIKGKPIEYFVAMWNLLITLLQRRNPCRNYITVKSKLLNRLLQRRNPCRNYITATSKLLTQEQLIEYIATTSKLLNQGKPIEDIVTMSNQLITLLQCKKVWRVKTVWKIHMRSQKCSFEKCSRYEKCSYEKCVDMLSV
jgi:hypothetical protein